MGFGWKNIKSAWNKTKKVATSARKAVTNTLNLTDTDAEKAAKAKRKKQKLAAAKAAKEAHDRMMAQYEKAVAAAKKAEAEKQAKIAAAKAKKEAEAKKRRAEKAAFAIKRGKRIKDVKEQQANRPLEEAFASLRDDPRTQERLKELSRRAEVGLETGEEELARTQMQSQVGAETMAGRRAMAATMAGTGMKGASAVHKLMQPDIAGAGKMVQFEGGLAAKDLAARESALSKLGQMEADVTQFDIGQQRALFDFQTAKDRAKRQEKTGFMTTQIEAGTYDPKTFNTDYARFQRDLEGKTGVYIR